MDDHMRERKHGLDLEQGPDQWAALGMQVE